MNHTGRLRIHRHVHIDAYTMAFTPVTGQCSNWTHIQICHPGSSLRTITHYRRGSSPITWWRDPSPEYMVELQLHLSRLWSYTQRPSAASVKAIKLFITKLLVALGKIIQLYHNYAKRLQGSYTTKVLAALGKAMKLSQSYAWRLPAVSGKAMKLNQNYAEKLPGSFAMRVPQRRLAILSSQQLYRVLLWPGHPNKKPYILPV